MIHRENRGDVVVLRMERGKVNALDGELMDELAKQLLDLRNTTDVAAIVLTGAGSAFSAGVDLFGVLDGDRAGVERFLSSLVHGMAQLLSCDLPVVAAINGHAIAGGCVLAAACDHRVMTSGKAKMGVTELRVGVPFPTVALEIMRTVLPSPVLQRLVYQGNLIGADEALACGLVDEVVAPEVVLDRAVAVAADLATIPQRTFALTKRQLRRPALEAIDKDPARHAVESAWESAEVHAAIRAFMDRTVRKGSA